MKKSALVTFAVMMCLTALVQAKDLPELSNAIERAVATQVMPFANERVKKMCGEWPTCQEWVANKVEQNPSFKVVDTEVERWVSKWDGESAIWKHRFYVQTQENGQIKAYVFSSIDQTTFTAPILIKKFPGHPIAGEPSRSVYIDDVSELKWPGYIKWLKDDDSIGANIGKWIDDIKTQGFGFRRESYVTETFAQYIYKYDNQSNALWKRVLYVKIKRPFYERSARFQAYQEKAGGEYTYLAPVEISRYPYRPHF